MSRTGKALLFLGLLVVLAFFASVGSFFQMIRQFSQQSGEVESKAHITVLNVMGPIMSAEEYLASIKRIGEDKQCKGVLVRIESPGGAVGASQEIFEALLKLRKKGMPVIVSQANIAASGGYYISLAGEKIFANPGTLTGSIGVIFQFPEAERLLEKVGVSLQTVKSGALKDVGNPGRKPTAIELKYLQSVIDDTFDQFVDDVVANRPITREKLLPVADGRVITGRQAKNLGLVDTLGGFDDAKAFLAKKAGLGADYPTRQEPKQKKWYETLVEESQSQSISGIKQLALEWLPALRPGLYFLYQQP